MERRIKEHKGGFGGEGMAGRFDHKILYTSDTSDLNARPNSDVRSDTPRPVGNSASIHWPK